MHSRIAGTGSYLPARILTNDELAKRVDTNDAWIRARTGIRERRIAAADEKTSDLALHAARAALAAAGIAPEETAYMGDDLLDAVIMRRVGYPMAVADAADEIKKLARYVSGRPGGHGAVRECIEHLLKRDSAWESAIRAIGADR